MNPLKKAMLRADELRAKRPEASTADCHEAVRAPSPRRPPELDPGEAVDLLGGSTAVRASGKADVLPDEVPAAWRERTFPRGMLTVPRVAHDCPREERPRATVRPEGAAEQTEMRKAPASGNQGSARPNVAASEVSEPTWVPVLPDLAVATIADGAKGPPADPAPHSRRWPGKLVLRGVLEGQTRVLRTRILDRLDGNGAASLLVTSPNPGEGKSVTALHLAASFAQELRRPTVLVAADFSRKASWSRGGEQVAGLVNYLTGQADPESILFESEIPNLSLIPVGWGVREAPALLSTEPLGALLEQIQRVRPGAFVIFDGPSTRGAAETLLLTRLVQGVIMVVAAESTPYRDLLAAAAHIGDGEKLLGIVYTKSRDRHL